MNIGQQDFQSLVLSCNKDGMDALRKGQHKAAFEQFKYAEAILIANQSEGDTTSLLAVTCNNLGCYYKKVGKLHGALSYLRRALKMEVDLKTHEVTLAGTHLNICAILSKLEKHDKAVQHALNALELINMLVSRTEPEKVTQDDYSVLAIAYHNVAVERDFLKEYEKAAAAFQQGYMVAKRCLGEDHPLSLTLGKNCDAVLMKSQKLTKGGITPVSSSRNFMKDGVSDLDSRGVSLPDINSGQRRGAPPADQPAPQESNAQSESLVWIEEEQAWRHFAQSAMTPGDLKPQTPTGKRSTPTMEEFQEKGYPALTPSPPPDSRRRSGELKSLTTPSFQDTINMRNGRDATLTPGQTQLLPKSPLIQAIDSYPAAMMDLIDTDTSANAIGAARTAPNDYRPNRVIKGASRCSRVVRRTGLFNTCKHRDQIMQGKNLGKGTTQKSEYVQKAAAEKIQRAWRSWFNYCQENSDWMTTTWICATMIQARWRSYHVRRMKLDRAARTIQKHVRGHLVRKMLKFHKAAVVIQRRIIGILTRAQLNRMHCAAVKVQSLMRSRLGRKRARGKKVFLTKTVVTMQCAVRCSIAKRKVRARRAQFRATMAQVKAAIDIQRFFRGWKGRNRHASCKVQYKEDLARHMAATKLQAMVRRDHASKRVDNIRADRLSTMNKAATFVRKMYLGAKTRKRYKMLVSEFHNHEAHIVTIQRYGRGFLVRLRMWREAIRAEEELWAALEIQRIYRGYGGRVRWESAFEKVWLREMGAVVMQRHVRGWLARTRVTRTRRKIARAEFERARRRFRAAQKIQSMARAVMSRNVVNSKRYRVVGAAIAIQRIARGHALRVRLWNQVIELRATMITSVARGFLVRNRRFHLIAKVIYIQRRYRTWQKKSPEFRNEAFTTMRDRKEKAGKIQDAFRKRAENKQIQAIQDGDELDKTQPIAS